jgi:hypothetical protein
MRFYSFICDVCFVLGSQSGYGSEGEDMKRYQTDNMAVSQNYEFRNLSFLSMENNHTISSDTAASIDGQATFLEQEHRRGNFYDNEPMHSNNDHHISYDNSNRLQSIDDQLESIDV